MKLKTAALIFVSLLVQSGCSDFDREPDGAPDDGQVNSKSLKDFVSVQVQPTNQPERYIVYFGWPKIEDGKRIRIRQEQTLSMVESGQTTFSSEVDHNQTATYTFDIIDKASRVERSFSKLVVVPRDFVVKAGQNEFYENQKISVRRVFIGPEIPIRTNGFNVEITTDELIADKGLIETHSENSTAAQGRNGSSAGLVILNARVATGNLKVIMRGQNGGEGLKGPSHTTRAADGTEGEPGTRECGCIRCDFLNLTKRPLGCSCVQEGSDGRDAANGTKGFPGLPGHTGGDTGTLKINIQEGDAFVIQTEKIVGLGGAGGPGGDGQPGGIVPGNGVRGSCSGRDGSHGTAGPSGEAGASGTAGNKGMICIYISNEGRNDCF